MIESSDPALCVESDLEEGSENIVVLYQYEPEESGSESESSAEIWEIVEDTSTEPWFSLQLVH